LSVLTDAQTKLSGPFQPAGKDPKVPVTAKPVIVRASLELKMTLTVWLAPASTDTVPATEGFAIIESLLPGTPPGPPKPLPRLTVAPVPPVVVPLVLFITVPASVPEELYPQAEIASDESALSNKLRRNVGIYFSLHVIEQRRSERSESYSLHHQCEINCVTH
jgi:hypothetical protein